MSNQFYNINVSKLKASAKVSTLILNSYGSIALNNSDTWLEKHEDGSWKEKTTNIGLNASANLIGAAGEINNTFKQTEISENKIYLNTTSFGFSTGSTWFGVLANLSIADEGTTASTKLTVKATTGDTTLYIEGDQLVFRYGNTYIPGTITLRGTNLDGNNPSGEAVLEFENGKTYTGEIRFPTLPGLNTAVYNITIFVMSINDFLNNNEQLPEITNNDFTVGFNNDGTVKNTIEYLGSHVPAFTIGYTLDESSELRPVQYMVGIASGSSLPQDLHLVQPTPPTNNMYTIAGNADITTPYEPTQLEYGIMFNKTYSESALKNILHKKFKDISLEDIGSLFAFEEENYQLDVAVKKDITVTWETTTPMYIIVDRAGHEASDQNPRFIWDADWDDILNGSAGEISIESAFVGVNEAGDTATILFKYGNYWCYADRGFNHEYDSGLAVSETLYGTYYYISNNENFINSGGTSKPTYDIRFQPILVEPYTE